MIATKDLSKTLAALPVSAWPYGRVAVVQEAGVRSAGDEQPIAKNKKAVKAVLKKLDVEAWLWPSA